MTAVEMIMRRSDISEDDAEYYSKIADMRVRMFLNVDDSEDLSKYVLSIVEISMLLYRSDKAAQAAEATAYAASVSISEGGVSKSVSAKSHSAILQEYEDAIQNELNNLTGQAGRVVFL